VIRGRIEKGERKIVLGCLVGKEKWEGFWKDLSVFFPSPPKMNLPDLGRKKKGLKSKDQFRLRYKVAPQFIWDFLFAFLIFYFNQFN